MPPKKSATSTKGSSASRSKRNRGLVSSSESEGSGDSDDEMPTKPKPAGKDAKPKAKRNPAPTKLESDKSEKSTNDKLCGFRVKNGVSATGDQVEVMELLDSESGSSGSEIIPESEDDAPKPQKKKAKKKEAPRKPKAKKDICSEDDMESDSDSSSSTSSSTSSSSSVEVIELLDSTSSESSDSTTTKRKAAAFSSNANKHRKNNNEETPCSMPTNNKGTCPSTSGSRASTATPKTNAPKAQGTDARPSGAEGNSSSSSCAASRQKRARSKEAAAKPVQTIQDAHSKETKEEVARRRLKSSTSWPTPTAGGGGGGVPMVVGSPPHTVTVVSEATGATTQEPLDGGSFNNGNAAAQQGGTPAVSALVHPAAQHMAVASKEGTLSVAFANSQPQEAQERIPSPSIIMPPPPGGEVLFTKPTTRFGWHMGPEQVPFVFGPFITKTEGLLMALLSQMSELDVALYLAMMGQVSQPLERERSRVRGSCSGEEAFILNHMKNLKKAQEQKPEVVYESLLLMHQFLTRVPDGNTLRPPFWLHSLLVIMCGFAVQAECQNSPLLFPEAGSQPLPTEYLVAMSRLIDHNTHWYCSLQRQPEIPHLQLARRCFLDLRHSTPRRGHMETAARLHLLHSLMRSAYVGLTLQEYDKVRAPFADENADETLNAFLKSPNAVVKEVAIRVLRVLNY